MAPVYTVIVDGEQASSTDTSRSTDSPMSMLSDFDDESIEILDFTPSTAPVSDQSSAVSKQSSDQEDEPPVVSTSDDDEYQQRTLEQAVHEFGLATSSEIGSDSMHRTASGGTPETPEIFMSEYIPSKESVSATMQPTVEHIKAELPPPKEHKRFVPALFRSAPATEEDLRAEAMAAMAVESKPSNDQEVVPPVNMDEELRRLDKAINELELPYSIENLSESMRKSMEKVISEVFGAGNGTADSAAILPEVVITEAEPVVPSEVIDTIETAEVALLPQQPAVEPSKEELPRNDVEASGSVTSNRTSAEENLRPPAYRDVHPSFESAENLAHYMSSDGKQFITLKRPVKLNADQLGCSARLYTRDRLEIHLHNEGCLMVVDNTFVATVKLLDPRALREARGFELTKAVVLNQLGIVSVLVDDLTEKRQRAREEIIKTLDMLIQKTAAGNERLNDVTQLLRSLQHVDSWDDDFSYQDLANHLLSNKDFSAEFRAKLLELLRIEDRTTRRNQFLDKYDSVRFGVSNDLITLLRQFRWSALQHYSKIVAQKAPAWLQNMIKDIPAQKSWIIHESDVKLFADLSSTLNPAVFEKPLEDLGKRWIGLVKSFKTSDIVGLMHPTFFFLIRSLEELINEISSRADVQPSELLSSNKSGWHPLKTIKWKTESNFTKCLQQEYYFIMKLIKHFDVAAPGTRKPFSYQTRLHSDQSSNTESFMNKLVRSTKQFFKTERPTEKPSEIAEEYYIWCCLLDDVLATVLPKASNELDVFDHVIQNFVKFVSDATVDQMETIRVITHNTVRFIVQTFPQHNEFATEDKKALELQLAVINRAVLASQGSESTNIFRDLIDVFNCYWKHRSEIIEMIPSKYVLDEMEQVKQNLLKVVLAVLEKEEAADRIVQLFRCFSDFLIDLNDVPFDWLVKSIPLFNMKTMINLKLIEQVDNKWSGTENQTFRVIQAKKFRNVTQVLIEDGEVVKHYMIEVINALLSMIRDQLNRTHWKGDELLSSADQLQSAAILIAAIRDSLLYLREQDEYVSFELFFDESLKPFNSVMENSVSLGNFCGRIDLVKESFWYIRKQNEMSIDSSLQLYRDLNDDEPNRELILQAYQRYMEQFERFMEVSSDEDTRETWVARAVQASVKTMLFKNWSAEFKQEQVPKILAGLAAVWSLVVSKDVASTGKYLKPHCIQILCVLRLLSVDNADQGIAKHLAQVLTGQGKSLILALIAALLALTGHRVQIACYNKYLVERDQADFEDFFKLFKINDSVSYETFESLANKMIAPVVDGTPVTLRDLVTSSFLKSQRLNKSLPANFKENSVLLMDEADVFFTEEFYGSGYYPVANPEIVGLGAIQEKIWSVVNQGCENVDEAVRNVKAFMSSNQFAEAKEFNRFYLRADKVHVLEYVENTYQRKSYTNQVIFDNHLRVMITDAIKVVKTPESQLTNVKLSEEGVILQKYRERFVNFYRAGYTTTFNYFRLKKTNFVAKIKNQANYGYLNQRCGAISYAMLPKDFALILGVTGTLTALNQHEKTTINNLYKINQSSVMPTFFGCSNLQFDPEENFKHFPIAAVWMNHIFSQAHAAIGSNRAVIVFFEDDATLEKFRKEYSGQFDRLNVLTENTDEQKINELISEAGVAKTITLATRGMGRGVDYKSSVAVEQNGGVHVIQTFFSLDVKEETQIKGRTARKDNKGSYELIVSGRNLIQQGLTQGVDEFSYAEIDAVRKDLSLKKNKTILESIQTESSSHAATMEYLKSFFK